MYFRKKTSGGRVYLQIAASRRVGGGVRQRVIATLGRLDALEASGQLERLVRSGARFATRALVVTAAQDDPTAAVRRIGPALVFERLWAETGCRAVIDELARERRHEFVLERAVFLTVLHRLMGGGSDLAADRWREDYRIAGVEALELHHLYRAMAWLGEALPKPEQDTRTPFAPRCTKDLVEERLFAHRRDLFSRLDLVFMDTTSLYFEGAGGQTLGRHGHSKDHRPDLPQMILAVLIDGDGRPVCSEMWPGNVADVATLIPVIDRLRQRFAIGRICVVADRGLISAETIAALEARKLLYLLGTRERTDKVVREVVLADTAPCVPLTITKRGHEIDYEAKAVTVGGQRYILCRNHQEAERDAAARVAILASLERQLAKGDKALVGNTGFRRFLKTEGHGHFAIDPTKAEKDAKFDGVFVLRTNTDLDPLAAMLRYKQLWTVEAAFRTAKHLLATRPIFHKLDETIRGHVFCSFLALVLKSELEQRIAALGRDGSWSEIRADLDSLTETEIVHDDRRFLVRAAPRPAASLALRAAGVALPPTVQALAHD
ncbi:MAG TPA: IS1634 family transposase [Burkholderiales bacterium]|nr:IS1634 family transposase [Burkholderiales bacterium]HEU4442404.1 IS1634 family transposase [Burkholderiales bacterium]